MKWIFAQWFKSRNRFEILFKHTLWWFALTKEKDMSMILKNSLFQCFLNRVSQHICVSPKSFKVSQKIQLSPSHWLKVVITWFFEQHHVQLDYYYNLFLYVSVENLAFYAGTFTGISGRSNHNHQHHCIGKLNLKSRYRNCIFISSDCIEKVYNILIFKFCLAVFKVKSQKSITSNNVM